MLKDYFESLLGWAVIIGVAAGGYHMGKKIGTMDGKVDAFVTCAEVLCESIADDGKLHTEKKC
jgi:hypothetical protein